MTKTPEFDLVFCVQHEPSPHEIDSIIHSIEKRKSDAFRNVTEKTDWLNILQIVLNRKDVKIELSKLQMFEWSRQRNIISVDSELLDEFMSYNISNQIDNKQWITQGGVPSCFLKFDRRIYWDPPSDDYATGVLISNQFAMLTRRTDTIASAVVHWGTTDRPEQRNMRHFYNTMCCLIKYAMRETIFEHKKLDIGTRFTRDTDRRQITQRRSVNHYTFSAMQVLTNIANQKLPQDITEDDIFGAVHQIMFESPEKIVDFIIGNPRFFSCTLKILAADFENELETIVSSFLQPERAASFLTLDRRLIGFAALDALPKSSTVRQDLLSLFSKSTSFIERECVSALRKSKP